MVTIYMPLLDENVDVWRPVEATQLADDLYRVHGPVPDEETWAFAAESVVKCEYRTFDDGERVLAATAPGTA
jgi:hypothetical protein